MQCVGPDQCTYINRNVPVTRCFAKQYDNPHQNQNSNYYQDKTTLETYVDPDYYRWTKQLDKISDKLTSLHQSATELDIEIHQTPTCLYHCKQTRLLKKKLRKDALIALELRNAEWCRHKVSDISQPKRVTSTSTDYSQ